MKGSDKHEKSTEIQLISWRNAPEGHGQRGAMNTDRVLCEARSTVERVEILALFYLAARGRLPRVEFTIIPYLAKFVNGKIAQKNA